MNLLKIFVNVLLQVYIFMSDFGNVVSNICENCDSSAYFVCSHVFLNDSHSSQENAMVTVNCTCATNLSKF